MKIKLGELFTAYPSLIKLAQIDFPIKISYMLLRYSKNIEEEFKILSEAREKIFRKYGNPDETGQSIVVPTEKMEEFNKEMMDFLKEEVDIITRNEEKPSIRMSEISNETKISIADMINLEPIIEFKDDTDQIRKNIEKDLEESPTNQKGRINNG